MSFIQNCLRPCQPGLRRLVPSSLTLSPRSKFKIQHCSPQAPELFMIDVRIRMISMMSSINGATSLSARALPSRVSLTSQGCSNAAHWYRRSHLLGCGQLKPALHAPLCIVTNALWIGMPHRASAFFSCVLCLVVLRLLPHAVGSSPSSPPFCHLSPQPWSVALEQPPHGHRDPEHCGGQSGKPQIAFGTSWELSSV